jgi:D-3-phosphoglycerate dehydrogenase
MGGFGMRVIAADPFVGSEAAAALGVELVPLPDLIRTSHVITVHVPLKPDTVGMIGEAEIAEMRDGVLLVNCARGGVVDEAALLAALRAGKIAAVGLDVYENEPPGKIPLFDHPLSVFTPHIGAATVEAHVRVATDVASSVADALTTGVLRNAVNQPPHPR